MPTVTEPVQIKHLEPRGHAHLVRGKLPQPPPAPIPTPLALSDPSGIDSRKSCFLFFLKNPQGSPGIGMGP